MVLYPCDALVEIQARLRQGINPFTKQEQVFAAKPARRVIKVRPLKALKDMAK